MSILSRFLTQRWTKRRTARVPLLFLGVCWVASLWSMDARADRFGRLFTTPEERVMLDRLRTVKPNKPKVKKTAPAAKVAPQPEPPVRLQAFRMDGVVVRRRGPNTAWMDGRQVLRRPARTEIRFSDANLPSFVDDRAGLHVAVSGYPSLIKRLEHSSSILSGKARPRILKFQADRIVHRLEIDSDFPIWRGKLDRIGQ